ncbi:tRNA1(Val) (adenine(37)-N6)-methyltransferase [Serratia entomophila]|uniref:tRNA(1)(Val) (adenine(37)-N(6))-methyltransferase TrmN n=1 Tax=Serratia entomophila TaxID=42906 RepID=UPI00217B3A43|nr:tRNA1(Val) (adenine(37)-N6)-methyltransferase [Serratia entomophila]CAI1079448.1 tRNA1(Val) (adenine(37)-N6)-methyltransferase [Serratia entomophila]CAI1807565.1 tRNA1(Val) (adenine(37)-N6)-methyltransferase [Serratia entomophila]CAI1845638.1 tRNA1(Val) (adenine(37)-N6)-methyltransferase [Serratia entomophila]CAI1933454.1 tRNA1(Val) (adenine(37)-N6)-methyltransferase [Serratia entomophila]CAI2094258.1 tRNA1(Val) (adenine(37)-N6)-methyltransferase [Serratia entomophila]
MLRQFYSQVVTVSNQSKANFTPRRGGFTFKQFFVAHDRCAMKVGTDGVLLGAWAPLAQARRVLDIGSGSGLIALMLAQRSADEVTIDAVELDEAAAAQARENVAGSPWLHRIRVHAQDIHHYAERHAAQYDLIVSNPPYFEPAVACRDQARHNARYTETLTHDALLACAAQLISEQGCFCVILPHGIGAAFESQAHQRGWRTAARLNVSDRADTPLHRVLLALTRQPAQLQEQRLAIKQADGSYTEGFRRLITEFYLFH